MSVNKNISLSKVYHILEDYCKDNSNPIDNRMTIYRFLNKLSDAEEFELHVNREFSAFKLRYRKDDIEEKLRNREEIQLLCGFSLIPYRTTNWQLYLNDELFLDSLDFRIARRIALDINVAFSIKVAQLNKLS